MRRQFNQNVNGRKTVAWCSLFAGEFSLFFGYLCDVLKRARHTFPGSHAIFSSQTKTLYWFGILFFFADFFDLRERLEWKYELLVVYNVHVPLQKGEKYLFDWRMFKKSPILTFVLCRPWKFLVKSFDVSGSIWNNRGYSWEDDPLPVSRLVDLITPLFDRKSFRSEKAAWILTKS